MRCFLLLIVVVVIVGLVAVFFMINCCCCHCCGVFLLSLIRRGGVGVIVGLGGAGQEMRDYSLDL